MTQVNESQLWAMKSKEQGGAESDELLKDIEEVRLKFESDICLK